MNLVFIDFETFWSETHSLSKMSPIAYCMHPETEVISCAVKYNNAPTDVFFGEAEIRRVFAKLDWSNNFVIAHNMSGFDSMLLAWRFGVRPKMWGCTLAMARPIHAKTTGLSLAKLVAHYELGVKDNRALIQTRGKRLKDFTPDELAAMEVYNKADTDQCAALFHKLKVHYTPAELWHLDCNIRMLVEPQFELDTGLLQTALSVERSNKHRALLDLAKLLKPQWEAADVTDGPEYTDPFWDQPEADIAEWVKTQMNSAPKFCAILEARGVEVPLKYSPTDPEKQIPAIAKTDEAMEELLEHDDEVVATAARARLSAKSTQLETRIQLFLDTYKIAGKLPVPAHYCGADTTGRDSGFLYNMYNLPRILKKPRVSDALRKSVLAPPGKVIMVRDSSGIELRVNHTLWKVGRSTQLWKKNPVADLYIGTAASYYGVPESEITKEDPRRQLGKVLELSCFAAGTLVLTDSGYKPIESVSVLDLVHDGLEWVAHEGVVCQGMRPTLEAHGLRATMDHEILTERGWAAWSAVATTPSLFHSALRLASLSSWSGGGDSYPAKTRVSGPLCVGARAAGQDLFPPQRFAGGTARDATRAPKSRQCAPACATGALSLCPEAPCAVDCYHAWPPLSTAAITATANTGVTTVAGASQFALPGARMYARFLRTSLRWTAGINRLWTWTASTTTAAMSQATFGLFRAASTRRTAAPSRPLRPESPSLRPRSLVYDLLNAGPRNRFVILTDAGPIVAHNCGFGIGHVKLRNQARAQYGLRLSPEEAKMGVDNWRARYPEITANDTGGWALCEEALHYIAAGDRRSIDPWGLLTTEKDAIVGPSGRRIRYPNLRQEWVDQWQTIDGVRVKKKKRAWVYDDMRKLVYLYGGKVDENIVQFLARDIVFGQILEFFKKTGMRPKHKVYDEAVYLVDPAEAADRDAQLGEIMRTPPTWWPELVVWSEGGIAASYGAAK